jgi:hypothetical protein
MASSNAGLTDQQKFVCQLAATVAAGMWNAAEWKFNDFDDIARCALMTAQKIVQKCGGYS